MTQEISLFRNFALATSAAISYSAPMNEFEGSAFASLIGNIVARAKATVRFMSHCCIFSAVCRTRSEAQ